MSVHREYRKCPADVRNDANDPYRKLSCAALLSAGLLMLEFLVATVAREVPC
jgi:hypothetical protein